MFFAVANTIMRAAMSTIAPIAAFIWNLNFNRFNLETRVWDLGGPPPPPPPVVGENWTANRLSLNLDSGSGQWVADRLSFKIA